MRALVRERPTYQLKRLIVPSVGPVDSSANFCQEPHGEALMAVCTVHYCATTRLKFKKQNRSMDKCNRASCVICAAYNTDVLFQTNCFLMAPAVANGHELADG